MNIISIALLGLLGLVLLKSYHNPMHSSNIAEDVEALGNWMKKLVPARDPYKKQKAHPQKEYKRTISYEGTRGGIITGLTSPITRALGLGKKSPPKTQQKPGHIDQSTPKRKQDEELFKTRQTLQFGKSFLKDLRQFDFTQASIGRERPGLIRFNEKIKSLIKEAR